MFASPGRAILLREQPSGRGQKSPTTAGVSSTEAVASSEEGKESSLPYTAESYSRRAGALPKKAGASLSGVILLYRPGTPVLLRLASHRTNRITRRLLRGPIQAPRKSWTAVRTPKGHRGQYSQYRTKMPPIPRISICWNRRNRNHRIALPGIAGAGNTITCLRGIAGDTSSGTPSRTSGANASEITGSTSSRLSGASAGSPTTQGIVQVAESLPSGTNGSLAALTSPRVDGLKKLRFTRSRASYFHSTRWSQARHRVRPSEGEVTEAYTLTLTK